MLLTYRTVIIFIFVLFLLLVFIFILIIFYYTKQFKLSFSIVIILLNNHVTAVHTVLMSPLNANKYDDFHIRMDCVIPGDLWKENK